MLFTNFTSQINNKLGIFLNEIKKIAFQKQHIFLLNEEVIWQVSGSSVSKELHSFTFELVIEIGIQMTSLGLVRL